MRDNDDVVGCVSRLTEAERNECVALILEGGAVERASSVRKWFPRSIRVAVKRSGGEIIGVGVIKPIRRRYANNVAMRSDAELDPETHELGYVAVKQQYRGRGISSAIVRELASAHGAALFATTWNARMISPLEQSSFVRKGSEWVGSRRNRLSLWVRGPLKPCPGDAGLPG